MIPFSPPRIDQKIIDEVVATLRSGWITTGPRTKLFEKRLAAYFQVPAVLCLNSATAGLELMLRWYGVKEGDEVILPAYTYSATANVVMHCGAKPVFVDVGQDFNIDPEEIRKAIGPRTKVIMPVDFGGWPCDYARINRLVKENSILKLFNPSTPEQQSLGRILVLSDSAHSIGAVVNGQKAGSLTDISVFSFHAVKNLTTAEGGAVALNLPPPFDNLAIYQALCVKSLHGQNKDALAKMQKGNWRYASSLKQKSWAILPLLSSADTESSYHLFALRIKGIQEEQRDRIMQKIFDQDVSVNVHFIPVPMMSFYKGLGYRISDYPVTLSLYENEISLPLFYDLTDDQVNTVIRALVNAVESEL